MRSTNWNGIHPVMRIDSSLSVEQDEDEEEHEDVVRVPEDFELPPPRVLGRGRVDEHHPHADDAAGEPRGVAEQRHRVAVGEGQVGEMEAAIASSCDQQCKQ